MRDFAGCGIRIVIQGAGARRGTAQRAAAEVVLRATHVQGNPAGPSHVQARPAVRGTAAVPSAAREAWSRKRAAQGAAILAPHARYGEHITKADLAGCNEALKQFGGGRPTPSPAPRRSVRARLRATATRWVPLQPNPKCHAASDDFDHALADIFPGEKPNQGCGQILEAVDNILAHLELAALDPSLEICERSLALRDEVHHQEALEG
jgi:hypothetical protein